MDAVGKGRAVEPEAADALERLLGVRVSLDGLSRLFSPGFPGIRTFVIEVRAAPDQAVEISLVGVARDGRPVWSGTRAFVVGRDGSLEIHRGFDEIHPDYQSRNITVDLIQRELDLLALVDRGATSRLTIDADEVGRYVCALHGFTFADETEEGPPVRSIRALDPPSDRMRLVGSAPALVERFAQKHGVGRIATESALDQLRQAKTPWDFARTVLPGAEPELADGDDGEMGVGALGRAFLLDGDTPSWRAALYLANDDRDERRLGNEYRRRKTIRSEARLAREIQECREALHGDNRAARLRSIEWLGMIGPSWIVSELREVESGDDRRAAAVARRSIARITGAALPDDLLAFAEKEDEETRSRGLAFRVLAEHFPSRVEAMVPMLRVHPDARIQRSVIPMVSRRGADAGPELAALLAANPWHEGGEGRPGLLALRLELIERLARITDPRTLPVLIAAYRAHPAPSPPEMLALSRALVGFADPRAQRALMEVARRFERPQIP